jgi:hypothetical protein
MPSRRLVDGFLVAFARRVQLWADRILAERDSILPTTPQAPPGSEGSSEAEPPDPPDDDGPPAHWLEMVRARAPHLLSTMARSPRPASPPTRPPHSTVTEAPTADPAQQDRGASDPAPTRPASLLGRIARPATTRTEIDEVPPRSEPAPSSWRSTTTIDSRSTPFPSPYPEGARETRGDPAAEIARSPAAPLPTPTPMRWRWRIESADEIPPTRRRCDPSPAQREATPERPPDPRSPAVHTPVPRQPAAPTPWRASTPDGPSSAAPIPGVTPAAVVRAELSRPASTGALPPRVLRSPPAGAGPLRAPIPAVTPTGAAPLDAPPPRSFDHARDVPSRSGWEPRPPARPVLWQHLPDDDELRAGAMVPQPRSSPPPPTRPGLWPRLPDEDEHDSPPQTRPTDPTWPVLPSDDLAALEAPVHSEDRGRSDRLRGEQQGARWSERHS